MHLHRRLRARRARAASDDGFTLIELLIVITILAILAVLIVLATGGIRDRGEDDARDADARILRTAEEAHCAKFGHYADEQGLRDAELLKGPLQYNRIVPGDEGKCGKTGENLVTSYEVSAIGGPAAIVGDPIPVGDAPRLLAVNPNPALNRIYVANFGDGSVSVIEGDKEIDRIPNIPRPQAIAVNPNNNRVYVASLGSTFGDGGEVVVIDGNTNQRVGSPIPYPHIPDPLEDGPSSVAVNTFNNKVYVCGFDPGTTVMSIDGATATDTGVACGRQLAVNNKTGKVYTLAGDGLNVINASGGVKEVRPAGGMYNSHDGIAVDESTNHVYVTGQKTPGAVESGTTWTFDGNDDPVGSPLTEPTGEPGSGQLLRYAPVVNPRLGMVYVLGQLTGGPVNVGRFNVRDRRYDRLSVVIGAYPGASPRTHQGLIAVDPEADHVYVVGGQYYDMFRMDGETLSTERIEFPELNENPFTRQAYSAAFNPVNGLVYVTSNSTPGYVRVVR